MNDDTPAPSSAVYRTAGIWGDHYEPVPSKFDMSDLSVADQMNLGDRLRALVASGVAIRPDMFDEIKAAAIADRESRLDRQMARPTPRNHAVSGEQVVYYILFADRVKIGTTSNLRRRLTHLPHDKLLAVELGGYDIEAERHQQFHDLRITGEWFQYVDPLLGHITALREAVA